MQVQDTTCVGGISARRWRPTARTASEWSPVDGVWGPVVTWCHCGREIALKKNMKVDETGWFIVSIWLIDISLQWSVFRGMLLKHSKTCARTNRRDVLLSKNRINHPKTSLVEGHDSAEMYCCYFFGLVHTEGANGIRVRLSGSKLATMLEWSAHSPVDLHCFCRL